MSFYDDSKESIRDRLIERTCNSLLTKEYEELVQKSAATPFIPKKEDFRLKVRLWEISFDPQNPFDIRALLKDAMSGRDFSEDFYNQEVNHPYRISEENDSRGYHCDNMLSEGYYKNVRDTFEQLYPDQAPQFKKHGSDMYYSLNDWCRDKASYADEFVYDALSKIILHDNYSLSKPFTIRGSGDDYGDFALCITLDIDVPSLVHGVAVKPAKSYLETREDGNVVPVIEYIVQEIPLAPHPGDDVILVSNDGVPVQFTAREGGKLEAKLDQEYVKEYFFNCYDNGESFVANFSLGVTIEPIDEDMDIEQDDFEEGL